MSDITFTIGLGMIIISFLIASIGLESSNRIQTEAVMNLFKEIKNEGN